jgi:hypothetical protein
VYVKSGSFEMWDGAVITNNDLMHNYLLNNSGVAGWISASVVAAVVVNDSTATFTMHGGEISYTNYRGVYIASGTFFMKGGRIINNGKSPYPYNGKDFYPRGGGVYNGLTSTFHMEGGEISGNGNAGTPGSGIWSTSDGVSTDNFLLNGPVTIQNNTIMVNHNIGYGIKIGSGFSTENVINIDLCYLGSSLTPSNYITYWPATKFLLYALNEADKTITIADVVGRFVPFKCFSVLSSTSATEYPTLSATINNDSSVTIVDTANQ